MDVDHARPLYQIQAGLAGGSRPRPGGPPPPGYGAPAGPPPGVGLSPEMPGPDAIPDFLKPSASYIPPTSGFFFGQVIQSPSLLSFLPTKDAGDRLMQRYFDAVHPVARCVHRPSFEIEYATFWDDILNNYEPRASVQAVVFAAWLSAAVSLDEATANADFGFTRANLTEHMKIGTETALSKANFLRTTRVETMQAFVMYMVSRLLPSRKGETGKTTMSRLTSDMCVCRYHSAELKSQEHTPSWSAPRCAWRNVWVFTAMATPTDSRPSRRTCDA
jgi:hypothetical protein